MLWTEKVTKYLKKYWGIESLKEKQELVINELLLGKDVIGFLPTGYGKSMCYLLPPLLTKKTIIIISPLISLMEDQKDKLLNMGLKCSALHGNNKAKDIEIFKIIDGKIKIVYCSPEYICTAEGMELIGNLNESGHLGFFAIDESHCISSWGHDFRPEYTKLGFFRDCFPDIPILAVTATATEVVGKDIAKNLKLNNPVTIRASFDRPNLYLKVGEIPQESVVVGKKIKNKNISSEKLVMPYLEKYMGEKIIIYTGSRNSTEELANKINLKIGNKIAEAYHAGLSNSIRDTIQGNFISGETKVIVSTIAFGMGIDQIVRCVIIIGAPSSIEEYYQQIGRGGRDGKPCETILFFNYSGIMIAKHMMKDLKYKFPNLYKNKLENLNKVSKFAYLKSCRRKYVLEYFNEACDFFTCGNCDNCCERDLVDMTQKIGPIVLRPFGTISTQVNDIKAKYLEGDSEELNLIEGLWTWRNYIVNNNLHKNLEKIPENLKLRIPKKFIKLEKKLVKKEDFEDKISKYESLLK